MDDSKSPAAQEPAHDDKSATRGAPTAKIDPKILELLVCPVTKQPLDYDEAAQELISRSAGLAFPIKDGIPVMLVDHARQLDDPAHQP